MASDDRARQSDRLRRRRPAGEQQAGSPLSDGGRGRGAPRRRSSYVPRQGSSRPRATERYSDLFDDQDVDQPLRGARPASYRPAAEQYDYYEEPDDAAVEGSVAPPPAAPRWRRTSGPAAGRDRYRDGRRRGAIYADDDDDYSDEFDDSFIDEDDWYEEEVAAGAARRGSVRSRRRNARQATRPSISVPRPSLPRPTVPPGVREAAIVQDQNAIILSGALLISVLLLALFTSNRVEALAPGFATHVTASGLPEEFRSETALWRLPLMAGALFVMSLVLAWFASARSRFLSRFFLASSALIQVLIWVAFLRIAY